MAGSLAAARPPQTPAPMIPSAGRRSSSHPGSSAHSIPCSSRPTYSAACDSHQSSCCCATPRPRPPSHLATRDTISETAGASRKRTLLALHMQLARILFLVRSSLHVQPPSPSRAPAAHSPPAGTEYHSPAIGMPLAPFGSGFRPTVRYIREPVGPHDAIFETIMVVHQGDRFFSLVQRE